MSQLPRRIVIAQLTALLAVLAIVVPAEIAHWREVLGTPDSFGINADTTLPLLLIVLLPYFWFVRRPFISLDGNRWRRLQTWWGAGVESPWARRASIVIAVTSLLMCFRVAVMPVGDREQYHFGDLPPAYHDEYSYRFQAQTYLAGRLSSPSHPTAPRLFDQMHVVNEGQFASRYFPATGLLIAPWLWLGWPILGHWLAGAATAVLVFGIGRELSNNGTGLIAGMLTALSPGMALFGNLVLAHHPTLLGLFFFAWSFLRWLRRGFVRDAAWAGIGLSWAMLCRPMTAAGFALPFGIVFVVTLYGKVTRSVSEGRARRGSPDPAAGPTEGLPNENPPSSTSNASMETCGPLGGGVERPAPSAESPTDPRSRFGLLWLHLLAMALPLTVGFVLLGIHNRAITGSVMTSPYQIFNDIYTPRHVYGFNNVVRGEQHLGPRVLDHYDRWAINLTPAVAVENTKNRLLASWQWTVGLVPLLAAVIVFSVARRSASRIATRSVSPQCWWLIFAAIVSLFVAHVPYWFDGIFHWHYVFETGPLWCLLLASATDTLSRAWLAAERPRMPIWWGMLIASSVVVNLIDFAPFWYPSKLQAGVEQIAFSRLKYQAFDELLRREVRHRPALVLIEADPSDRHIDYVVNEPSLAAELLRGRYPVANWPLEKIIAEFPNRSVYLFRAKTGELRQVSRAKESADAK
ncbi:MAG: ArnT family glycosyltransferase [Planctomycetaceae bacterium]